MKQTHHEFNSISQAADKKEFFFSLFSFRKQIADTEL